MEEPVVNDDDQEATEQLEKDQNHNQLGQPVFISTPRRGVSQIIDGNTQRYKKDQGAEGNAKDVCKNWDQTQSHNNPGQ